MKNVEIFVWKWRRQSGLIDACFLTKAAAYQDEGQDDEEICDHAFRIFNAPEEYLLKEEKEILGDYHRNFPSLSVDDFVKVGENCFRCASVGWEKVESIPERTQKN